MTKDDRPNDAVISNDHLGAFLMSAFLTGPHALGEEFDWELFLLTNGMMFGVTIVSLS